VADEIEKLVSETGIQHIEFTDSTFNIPLTHAKAVLRALAARNLKLTCRTMGLNPSAIDDELVRLMRRVGFNEVDLGVESGCNQTLRGLGKNFTKQDVLRAGRRLQAYGIATSWFLLVGAPGETVQTLNETFETIAKAASPWDLVVIGVGVRLYKGSPLSVEMMESNPDCTKDNFLHPIGYQPEGLDLKTIKVLTKQVVLKRPNFLMYDEEIQYPEWVIKGLAWMLRWFAGSQPLWRVHILVRRILHYIGVDAIRQFRFHRRYRDLLASLPRDSGSRESVSDPAAVINSRHPLT
jgi:radical SAM superfamily enzyme YgiQ (UPF0313 family)